MYSLLTYRCVRVSLLYQSVCLHLVEHVHSPPWSASVRRSRVTLLLTPVDPSVSRESCLPGQVKATVVADNGLPPVTVQVKVTLSPWYRWPPLLLGVDVYVISGLVEGGSKTFKKHIHIIITIIITIILIITVII